MFACLKKCRKAALCASDLAVKNKKRNGDCRLVKKGLV
ncbi:hypothetical protein EAZG_00536 [Escherichia coli TA249]|nr:hypothetical protein EC30301_0730 [Escherichia coli 3030-1]OSL85967.1 hypothetical protein EAZG_00536 [Escherichia coli TA249]